MDVTVEIQEALIRRLGAERYALWFHQGVSLEFSDEALTVTAENEFMVERLRKRLLADLQAVAKEVVGRRIPVRLQLAAPAELNPETDSPSETGLSAECDSSTDERAAAAMGNSAEIAGAVAGAQQIPAGRRRSAVVGASERRKGVRGGTRRAAHPLRLATPEQSGASARESAAAEGPATSGNGSPMAGASVATFCVGECNRLAFTATRMVVDQPGSVSPLFFWGPAGTGKTHLLAAIRSELRRRHGLRRVVMLSAEQFTNDFTGAVRGSGLPGFRRRYRDVDALLVDDVQFVGGKRATLRELLYTVDTLLRGRCQLAFTADRPPLDLEGLSEELAGRMAGGMVCALRPLDRDTRRGVLQSMVDRCGAEASGEVLDRLADELAGDARILSGAVNHLHTLTQMLGRPVTWDELQQSAPELIAAGRPAVNLGDIQKAVCDMFGLPSGSLRSRGQQRAVSQPRMLAMYLARQYTRAPFSEIGDYFGNRSHSTVIAATKRVEDWLAASAPVRRGGTSMQTRQAIEAIENLLRTG